MNISLTPELEQFVTDRVGTGMYHSASEVVREALRLLKEKDVLNEIKIAQLRLEIQKGRDSGEPQELDLEEFIRQGKKRLEN